jgi:hypothetical protein
MQAYYHIRRNPLLDPVLPCFHTLKVADLSISISTEPIIFLPTGLPKLDMEFEQLLNIDALEEEVACTIRFDAWMLTFKN